MRLLAALGMALFAAGCSGDVQAPAPAGRAWDVAVAPAAEPGERLVLTGVLRDPRGRPLPNVSVRIYHSDAAGNYSAPGQAWARLNAIARTGSAGEIRIRTILPASDNRAEPPHIHFEIVRPGNARQPAVLYLERAPSSPAAGAPGPTLPVSESLGWHPPRTLFVSGLARTPIARDSSGTWQGTFELQVP